MYEIQKSREQSENVYENKGQVQKVAMTLALDCQPIRGFPDTLMKNDFLDPSAHLQADTVDRRRFLQSAVGASLALTGTSRAQTKRPALPNALIRVGLIGSDGHREVLLSSIPKLPGVQWTAYAKGEPGENCAWVRKQFPGSCHTRVYEDLRIWTIG
jgi:hypothetical protein